MSQQVPPVSAVRVMGAETEFGISQPGRPGANPMRDSARTRTPLRAG